MTEPTEGAPSRACQVCGTDISALRSDARVCKDQQCRNASKRLLSRRWTTAEAKQCTVAEGGVQCPTTATRRLTTADPMCDKHDMRANRHGDPTTVKAVRRPHGEVQALLQQAAAATGDECFIIANPDGGRVSVSYQSQPMTASRAVWMIAHGDPGEAQILHTCHRGDVGCASIRHLKLGDTAQNMIDMVEADRSCRGERSGQHKLKEAEARAIRARARAGENHGALAREFNVSRTTISNIKAGDRWAWLDA